METNEKTQISFTAEGLFKYASEESILKLLPASLLDLLNIIPLSEVLVLIEKYGGHYICISSDLFSNNTELKKHLSLDSVKRLSERYSGDRLAIAKAQKLRCFLRDQKIIQLHKSGVTVVKLTQQFDLSERCIYYIFRKYQLTIKEQ